ncbi:hypothetical protein ACH4SK_23965 [Streptomyces inhibens]|uniref:hypothetical protein n=1 Tax=Streptomyces inhibens TaxID=2293571 RepID=UPI0037B59B11
MIRTIRRAAVLAALPAALAIGVTATPASAATIGTAYDQTNFTGNTASLDSGQSSCTDIPNMTKAFSAQNTSSSSRITLYRDSSCLVPVSILQPSTQDDGVITPLGIFGAEAYTST